VNESYIPLIESIIDILKIEPNELNETVIAASFVLFIYKIESCLLDSIDVNETILREHLSTLLGSLEFNIATEIQLIQIASCFRIIQNQIEI
jgi:hypothetical protein